MLLPRDPRGGLDRRGDRSLGWPSLYSRQSSALARALSAGRLEPFSFPPSPVGCGLPERPRPREGAVLRAARLALRCLALALAFYVLATSLLVACYRYVDPPATVLMAYRKFGFGWKIEAPRPQRLERIPLYIRRMLVSVEDGKFYEHRGLDFEAFRNAREINARIGKPLYGGSTLTMQVARTLFLVPVKSYLRKGLEVIVALELELFLGKDRILELYFGYAEWGKGVFGLESAARRWYGRGARALSRDEAARLVALLSSPVKYSPSTLSRSGILRERYAYLYRRYVAPQAAAAEAPIPVSPNVLSTLDAASGAQAASSAPAPEAPGAEAPPPSVEPGAVDADAEPAAAPLPGAPGQDGAP